MSEDVIQTFESGAKSSGLKPPYHLIPKTALKRIAVRFGEGARKYGEDNWKTGTEDHKFLVDRLNHAVEHLQNLQEKLKSVDMTVGPDDDAAAVILNVMFIMEAQRGK